MMKLSDTAPHGWAAYPTEGFMKNSKTSAINPLLDNKTQQNIVAGSNPRHTACRLLSNAHHLRRAVRALQTLATSKESELVTLLRVGHRVEGIARLVSEVTKNLKLAGVSKNDPIIEVNGRRIGLQKLSRRLRTARVQLNNEITAMTTGNGHPGQDLGGSGQDKPGTKDGDQTPTEKAVETGANAGGIIGGAIALGVAAGWLFNQEDDDNARTRIAEASHEEIRHMDDHELVTMINAMIDGPTGDDDEGAILKILQALDCEKRIRIVNRIGVDILLDNIDGAEWDRLVNLLVDCGIIKFDQMDDDASRLFVNDRNDPQLAVLHIHHVRQLVLNMFSVSCGDDDEDAILKLLRPQSTSRLHQLVAMPSTEAGDFDYNFDGDQWDDLEALFARHGIVLDT